MRKQILQNDISVNISVAISWQKNAKAVAECMQVRIQYTRAGWVLLKPFVSLASASMTGTQSHRVHDDRDAELGLVRVVGVVVVASSDDDDQKARQIYFFLLLVFCVFFVFSFNNYLSSHYKCKLCSVRL